MNARLPKDPLDDPIAEFVQAVDEFLAMNLDFEAPAPITSDPNGGWDEVKRIWEHTKQAVRKLHTSFVGVQPEVNERLEVVSAKGSVVLGLTDDPLITGPTNELMALASQVGGEINKFGSVLAKAASVLGFFAMMLELAGMKKRLEPLSARITAARDALIAYNLMRTRPPEPA